MAVNKVIVNGVTKLDLTSDTITPAALVLGTTAHDKSGAPIVGTYEGSSLNFSVKQYPSSTDLSNVIGEENEIAVLTDVAFSSWSFSSSAPSDPSANDVWIKTATSSRYSIEILTENSMVIRLLGVYQYISNSWVRTSAFLYQSGQWKNFTIFLYDNGDQCVSESSGWKDVDSNSPSRCHFYDNRIYINFSSSASGYISVFTKEKINFSGYTKLCAKINLVNQRGTGNYRFRLGLTTANTSFDPKLTSVVRPSNVGEQILTLDISSYKDSAYYINMGGAVELNVTIYEVWLE